MRALSAIIVASLATPALAHPGAHAQLSVIDLVAHYAEPDHLAFLVLTVLVGFVAFRAGRRAEARSSNVRRDRERHS